MKRWWTMGGLTVWLTGAASLASAQIPTIGLTGWFRADVGVTNDGSGRVSSWADQSPSTNHAVQPTAGQRPQIVAAGLNGKPTLRFDGADDVLQLQGNVDLTPALSVFIVARNDVRKNYNGLFRIGPPGNASRLEIYWQQGSGGSGNLVYVTDRGGVFAGHNNYNTSPEVGTPYIVSHIVPTSSTHNFWSNGQSLGFNETYGSDFLPAAPDVAFIGLGYDGVNNFGSTNRLDGDISEVIFYNRGVSTAERQQIETYLSNKYGIATVDNPTPDVPLPVELTGFDGSGISERVALSWTTAAERDNRGFIVLRDGQPVAGYRTEVALQGHGTTAQPHRYSFTDTRVRVGATYRYTLRSVDGSGTEHAYAQVAMVTVEAATPNPAPEPTAFALHGAAPNPFNPTTTLRYDLPAVGPVRLDVFDGLGRRIRTLADGVESVGSHQATFDASGLPSGVYLVRLTAAGQSRTVRVLLAK